VQEQLQKVGFLLLISLSLLALFNDLQRYFSS
jgi:regulator of sigma E protease